MLKVQSIQKVINGHHLLKNVSLDIQPGTIHGILGPNGAGKTTLFSILIGLESPLSGNIFLDTEEITKLSPAQRIHKGLVYLPQEYSLFQDLTVQENLECVLELKGINTHKRNMLINKIIEELSLSKLINKKALYLSGGQKRRVEFARILLAAPQYVLLDEPFAGVDPLSIKEIKDQVLLLKNKGIGVLISDHQVDHILNLSSYVYLLIGGEMLFEGTPENFLASSLVQESYLGPNHDSLATLKHNKSFVGS